VKQSLPDEARDHEMVATCIEQMMADYSDHCLDKTHLYNGISELTSELASMKIALAVLSNKAEPLTIKIVNRLLSDVPFRKIMGAGSSFPKKPDPKAALFISDYMGIPPEKLIYMGDSDVDMITSKNAGMVAVGVSWGFRTPEELLENGAEFIIDRPQQVKNIIQGS
jgi:phosphoglycolate phosphatase